MSYSALFKGVTLGRMMTTTLGGKGGGVDLPGSGKVKTIKRDCRIFSKNQYKYYL